MSASLVALFTIAFALTALAAGPSNSLESATTGLAFDSAGHISALLHTPAKRNLASSSAAPTYTIQLADPETWITSAEAVSTSMSRDAKGAITIVSRHIKPAEFTVTCRFVPEVASAQILGTISIQSAAPQKIASVTFPTINLALPLSGTGADDAVVLPECDGAILTDPLKNDAYRDMGYPGGASMQFLAAYDKTAGVYLASRDSAGNAKFLAIRHRDKTLDLSLRHMLPQTAITQWSLPYSVAITTYTVKEPAETGWETAANLYRAWATQQPWCSKTLEQRVASGDVPAWLAEPSLFYAFSLRGRLPDGKDGLRTSLVADHADAWRNVVGGPVTFMLMTWEKHGPWVGPDYFPPTGDGDSLTAATRALHERGHHTMVYLSGLNWTLAKTDRGFNGVAIDDYAQFNKTGRPFATADAKGEAIIYGKPAEDVGQYARICPSTPLADDMIRGSSLRCQDFGIDCVQADQIVGGGAPACFSPNHTHEPGGGNWTARNLYDLFAKARTAGKAKEPNFAFSIEEPGEFYIPVLDTYHARDYMQNRWPRYGQGIIGVPLFTHVYHDYLHGYGGDSTAVTAGPNTTALYEQAMNLVCGKAPAVCMWISWLDPATVDPAQKRMLRSHFDLWRGEAKEFLIYGRRISTGTPSVPAMELAFTDWPSKKTVTMPVPTVLESLYQLPDGRTARILACISPKPVTITLDGQPTTLDPGQAIFHREK